jgi:hypothetical protein
MATSSSTVHSMKLEWVLVSVTEDRPASQQLREHMDTSTVSKGTTKRVFTLGFCQASIDVSAQETR